MWSMTCVGMVLLAAPAAGGAADTTVTVTPREIDAVLANPGCGWQTFHCFADQDDNLQGLPSTSAYFRFYWRDLEPAEGKIDFQKLDALLAHARKAGQKFAFRIMCAGTDRDSIYVPPWLKEQECKGFEYRYEGRGPLHWIPDMDDPRFQKAHFRFIGELGKRYDGHPDLDLVDIGTVGHWGEWHMSGTNVSLPTVATRLAIIDVYQKAFPRTPKVMLIGDEEGMKYATAGGCGWRADCLGDMGGFSSTWCHMRDFYPPQVKKTGAADAWKAAPVAFESCWDMRKWKEEQWDIPGIFDFALAYHASYVNNKSAPIPAETRPEIERFLRTLGYRMILRSLSHARAAAPDSRITLAMVWENAGVAPPYRDYLLAFRLADSSGAASPALVTTTSLRGWLPGKKEVTESFTVPAGWPAGRSTLAVAFVDPASKEPAIRLAIEGRAADGWYAVSRLDVTGK